MFQYNWCTVEYSKYSTLYITSKYGKPNQSNRLNSRVKSRCIVGRIKQKQLLRFCDYETIKSGVGKYSTTTIHEI